MSSVRFIASSTCCAADAHERTSACSYQVNWAINPHMIVGSVDPFRAQTQHDGLVRSICAHGGEVTVMPFVHGAFDSVFAKDNAIYSGARALLGSPRHDERRIEQRARYHELARHGFELESSATPLEGGDVIVVPGRCAFLGYGFRSARQSERILEQFLGLPVITLELTDPSLYHLDTALAVLADGSALVCDEAFSVASRQTLRAQRLGDVIAVSREAALKFALNFVELDRVIVTGTLGTEVDDILAANGKSVVYVELGEFHRAGGSAACLLAPLRDDHVALTTAATTAMRSTAA